MSADERRESVLRAAIIEFSKGGLAGTSTEDIARRADISQPYLFRLFGTKKELFLAAVERTFDRALSILVEAAGDRTGLEAKMAMSDAYRMFLNDRTLLLTQMHAYAACDDDDVRRVTQTCFGKMWQTVADITGFDDDDLIAFFGHGMLLNMAAAMDLMAVIDLPWVKACLGQELSAQATDDAAKAAAEIAG
jgi:AcrR family transcriptional regulator